MHSDIKSNKKIHNYFVNQIEILAFTVFDVMFTKKEERFSI